jgi:hypothetical protein
MILQGHHTSRRARARIYRSCTSRRKFMFTSPDVLIVVSLGCDHRRAFQSSVPPSLPPRVLSKCSGRAIRMPRRFVDYLPGSAIPLAHMPKKHPRSHVPPQNQILWDFFVSTQRAPRYFPQTTQIYLYVVPVCRGLDPQNSLRSPIHQMQRTFRCTCIVRGSPCPCLYSSFSCKPELLAPGSTCTLIYEFWCTRLFPPRMATHHSGNAHNPSVACPLSSASPRIVSDHMLVARGILCRGVLLKYSTAFITSTQLISFCHGISRCRCMCWLPAHS